MRRGDTRGAVGSDWSSFARPVLALVCPLPPTPSLFYPSGYKAPHTAPPIDLDALQVGVPGSSVHASSLVS